MAIEKEDRFDDQTLLEVLQEAAQTPLSLNNPPVQQNESLRDAMMKDLQAVEDESNQAPAAPPVPEPTPTPTPVPDPVPEIAPTAEPTQPVEVQQPEVIPDPTTTPDYEIPPEDLEKYYTYGKVHGETKKYTLQDLVNVNQTQDAATNKLEEYKNLVNEYKELAQRQASPTQPDYEPELLTDEEQHIRNLENKVDQLTQIQARNETDRFTEAENAYVLNNLSESGLSQEDFGGRVNTMLEANPKLRHYAEEVFTKSPTTRSDLERRQGMFDLLLTTAKSMDTPNVVKTTRDAAYREGQVAAKVEAKRGLTNVDGISQPSEPTRAELINKATKIGSDDAWADLMLETGMFKEFT